MLDPRVRTALAEFQRGRQTLEATAQVLLQVRRETGCLDLLAASTAGAAERALLARFAELVAAEGLGSGGGPPVG